MPKKVKDIEENNGIVVAAGLQDIGCSEEDRFPVFLERRGKKVRLDLKPVTMEMAEKVRNAFPMPDPPLKVWSDKEKLDRRMNGQPLNVPDYENEEYKQAVNDISIKIEWGILRAALGFDPDPTDELDAWIVEAKKVFLPGDYMEILSAVNKGSDIGGMIDRVTPF